VPSEQLSRLGAASRTAIATAADYEASLQLIDTSVDDLVAAGCLAKDRSSDGYTTA